MKQGDGLPPVDLLHAPLPEQLDCLAPVLHAAEPDMESFVNHFHIENWSGL